MQTQLQELQKRYPDSPKSRLKKWIRNGRFDPPKKETDFIIYEDRHIVVINKPAGLLSVASDHGHENSAHKILKERCKQRVYPVHRLDKYASGLLVFAYTVEAKEGLKEQFADHSVQRVYHATVEGIIEKGGTWESCLWEDGSYHVHSSQHRGKRAITHYEPIRHTKETTLLRVQLETGRKNQIRVHCAEAGHPIVGDEKYGSTLKRRRISLHAYSLSFIHPITKKTVFYEAAL